MTKKASCFTGHRKLLVNTTLKANLFNTLVYLIQEEGVTDFYAGGALGWDTLCERATLYLKTLYPQVNLHLVLPCPEKEQTLKWQVSDKAEYRRIFQLADTVEICSPQYTNDCMKIRNQQMINYADFCVCYYDGKYGGTAQTVQFAKKKGIKIFNLYSMV